MGDWRGGRAQRAAGGALGRVRSWVSRASRMGALREDSIALSAAVIAVVFVGVLATEFRHVPYGAIVVPVLAAGLFLRTRSLAVVDLAAAAVLLRAFFTEGVGPGGVPIGVVAVIGVTAGFAHLLAASRERLGLQGLRGDSMLVELRDRLLSDAEAPVLPGNWHAEVVLRSAGGSSFGGDFVVSTLSNDGKCLELVVVDVSGKGVDAATRALQLSGALGGILGSLPPEQFLVAANNYLLRQDWAESFATALHVTVDLTTGDYAISSAGHPPAVQFDAGAGRWHTVDVEGPLLGLDPCRAYDSRPGVLRHGDALLLYTDGLIEVPGRDLAIGIDKLLGQAERLVTVGFADGAAGLIDAVAPGGADDRALVVLWRG